MLLAVVLLVLVVLGVWVHWRYKNRRLLEMSTKIPGPPTIPILGNAFYFMCRPEGNHLNSYIKSLLLVYAFAIFIKCHKNNLICTGVYTL